MKDELGKGYMTEFAALSPKVYENKKNSTRYFTN